MRAPQWRSASTGISSLLEVKGLDGMIRLLGWITEALAPRSWLTSYVPHVRSCLPSPVLRNQSTLASKVCHVAQNVHTPKWFLLNHIESYHCYVWVTKLYIKMNGMLIEICKRNKSLKFYAFNFTSYVILLSQANIQILLPFYSGKIIYWTYFYFDHSWLLWRILSFLWFKLKKT